VKFKISEEIRHEASQCWRGFRCLLTGENGMCPVHDCVGDVLFVEKTGQDYCPYDVTFGYSHICTCPVRQEIYDQYGE